MAKTEKKGKKNKNTSSQEVGTESVIKVKQSENQIKAQKKSMKHLKKAAKNGLGELPAPVPVKSLETDLKKDKKVLSEEDIAAKKEKRKLKKLAKKLKKKASAGEKAETKIDTENVPIPGNKNSNEILQKNIKTDDATKKKENKMKKKLALKAAKGEEKKEPKNYRQISELTVFIGNLPTNTKPVQIKKLLSAYGEVQTIRMRTASGKVIFKHKSRKESNSLNAYATMKDAASVAKALSLNGVEFKGNHLRVTKSNEKPTDSVNPKLMVFVGNLKYSATDEKIHQIFSSCGEIEYVRTVQSAEKEGCNGTAFVCFKNPDSVGLALELKGTILDDRPINVERYSITRKQALQKQALQKKTLQEKNQKNQKNGKQSKNKDSKSKTSENGANIDDKKKKSEFRGVKSDGIKKKQKKKVPSQMKKLANKIAPKNEG